MNRSGISQRPCFRTPPVEFSEVLSSWLQWHRNFCLQRQCPLTEPREMWSALRCGRIWVDEWPFFGLSGCRIALDMQKGVSNWMTMVEPCGIHNCLVEKQVESSGILHSMAFKCPVSRRTCWDLTRLWQQDISSSCGEGPNIVLWYTFGMNKTIG